jgi:6-phospho-beta-glucosidase
MKIAVIGGGSSYTPELIDGLIDRATSLQLAEVWLVDIDAVRLDIVGGFARRMVAAKGDPFQVQLSTKRDAALDGADYVITQLRVGGMQARRQDEYLGRRHGLIGQETTGVGGMAKALRTIPVVVDIARDMQRLAPGAILFNFANPAGLVTQAVSQWVPQVPVVGVCNAPFAIKMEILRGLKEHDGLAISPGDAELDCLGLNHLAWYRGLRVQGQDLWPQVIAASLEHASEMAWDTNTLRTLNMIPNYYLEYYYYTSRKLEAQKGWPPSRAEEVMVVEEELLTKYADPQRTEPPEELMKRGGAHYSTVASQLLNAHQNDLGERHIANVRHDGAVPGWPRDWVLEMPCQADADGVKPLPAEPLPPACFGLLAAVKSYELLTAEAAMHGSLDAAYQALLVHPLGPEADQIQVVLDDMMDTNRDFLPRFGR